MANDWGMQQIRLHSSTQTWKFQRQEPAPCTFPRHNQKVGRHMSSLCPHKTHSGKGYCSRSEDPIISSGGQETDSSCQKIWTMAWQALEPPQACNEKGKPRVKRKGPPKDLPGGTVGSESERPLKKPMLCLQGLEPNAKVQLIALSLLALEMQMYSLPLEFASLTAAQGWLGYTPPPIKDQAEMCLRELESGCATYANELLQPVQRTVSGEGIQQEVSTNESDKTSESLWDAASERVSLHALYVRHVLEAQHRPDTPGPNTSKEEECEGSVDDSQNLQNDLASETISPPNPRWWNLVRENLAAALGNSKQGIVGRRSWPATAPEMSAQNGQMSEGVRPISTTRNAAIRLMKTSNSGVRGWTSDPGLSIASSRTSLPSSAANVLQDMAIIIAEAIATTYLAEASSGLSGGPARVSSLALHGENWPAFLHPNLSDTRSLERFRNKVAFQRFLDRNWDGVAAIYEDKHRLWGCAFGGRLVRRDIPARRAKELNNLKGWKQAVSLILEALDFATPLILQIGKKGSEALSWLLVALIGRSLGLIFKGIKQSLGFKRERNSANAKKEASSVML